MPTIWVFAEPGDKKPVPRFQFFDIGEDMGERLLEIRKAAIQQRDEMLALQKRCGRDDIEGARFFRDEAADRMMTYRATTYLIPLFLTEYPKDCRDVAHKDWPSELFDRMDVCLGMARG